MDLIPYSKVKIETKLSQKEVLSRISKNTRISDSFEIILKQHKEVFFGEVYLHSFKIYRYDIRTKNSFLPIFNGKVIQKEKTTEIEMKISPPIIGSIFIAIAFVVITIMALTQVLNEYILLIPILIYGLITYSFHSLRKEYLQKIYEIIEGESMIEL